MTIHYQLTTAGAMVKATDEGTVTWLQADDPEYLAWVTQGNTPDPADPEPEPEPTRDERILASIEEKKAAVAASSAPAATKALLADILDGLGAAIVGEAP